MDRLRSVAWQAAGFGGSAGEPARRQQLSQALAQAERLTGRARIVTASSERALPGIAYTGTVVNICVFDRAILSSASTGKVRITSRSAAYDSGDQPLALDAATASLCYHWDTTGLPQAQDYGVFVDLLQGPSAAGGAVPNAAGPDVILGLRPRSFEPFRLAECLDASAPGSGFPLEFRRVTPQDSANSPYLGPLGRGWMHGYDAHLQEFSDGRIAFLGPDGFNRWFRSTPDGRYLASPGDFATLARDADGTFTLTEKGGFQYSFTSAGQLTFVRDSNGNRVAAAYSSANQLVSLTHSSGAVFRLTYNAQNRIATLTDHVGRQTRFGYSADGQFLTSVTSPSGAVTTYTYNGSTGLPDQDRLLSIVRPDATHAFFTYDSLGRLTSRSADQDAGKLTYTYDADGTTHIQDAAGAAIAIRVNDARRPTEFQDSANGVTTFSYDSGFDLVGIVDALGRHTRLVYDENGNIIQYDDPAGTTTWGYEHVFNRPTWVRDSAGHLVQFFYDSHGNLTHVAYPDNSAESFSYDGSGNIVSRTTRLTQTITYTSDARGLLGSKTYPDGSTASYTYDIAGNLVSATNAQGTISLQYDAADRLVAVTYPGGRTFQYSYDAAGKRTQATDPDGAASALGPGVLSYQYDSAGRLSRIQSASGALVASYQYDAAGRLALRTLANGASARFEYDNAGRVNRVTNLGPSGSQLSQYSYSYDAAGNPLSRQSAAGKASYSYDGSDRLSGFAPETGAAVQYSYDALGNRTAVTSGGAAQTYAVNQLNQYTAIGSSAIAYDRNGALTSRGSSATPVQYSYDFEDRLIAVRASAGTVRYAYDALGLLYSRSDASSAVRLLHDGLEISVEENDAHQSIAKNVWGQAADEILQRTGASGSALYYAQDLQGNVSEAMDAGGRVAEAYRYDPFGVPSGPSAIGNPFLFAGAYYDAASGLSDFRTRWYAPDLGRFIQPNSLGVTAGLNLYTYAGTNPMRFRDPLGVQGGTGAGPGGVGGATGIAMASGAVGGTFSVSPEIWSVAPGIAGPFSVAGLSLGPRLPWPPALSYRSPILGIGGLVDARGAFEPGAPPFGGGVTGAGGGACPTFIQLPDNVAAPPTAALDVSRSRLAAKITVPVNGALVRADVPVFGVAGGSSFQEYRVEYGAGTSPIAWHLIARSSVPQPRTDVGLSEMRLMQGDLDIRGNLATWNTGLKNWVHLPWHPPEDTTDLNGIYTLRLVAVGKDGQTQEDRVTVTVGRAIAQALPGEALSPDGRVRMRFRAQSLTRPFRVYAILPVEPGGIRVPLSPRQLSSAYEITPGGDRFIKDVALEFVLDSHQSVALDAATVGIAQSSTDGGEWKWLPTESAGSAGGRVFRTTISELPAPRAIYTLGIRPAGVPAPAPARLDAPPASLQGKGGILVFDTFEKGFGAWKSGDRFVGAILERDNQATPDGSYALQLTNPSASGNFSVSVLGTPFDAARYSLMSFDYRIAAGVKTDFYLSVGGRWYDLAFTGDAVTYRNRDVNIANLGRIPGIVADNAWHTAQVNLYELLRTRTAHTRIDEIRMADWNATGYMKLEFGRNARGAVYYIDNFKLSSDGSGTTANPIVLDDFAKPGANALGGATGTFSAPGTDLCHAKTAGSVLKLAFDTRRSGSWCGYYTVLKGLDLDAMRALSMRVRGPVDSQSVRIGLRQASTQREIKAPLRPYALDPDPSGWRTVRIPLSVFRGLGLQQLASIDLLSLAMENDGPGDQGAFYFSDLRAEPTLAFQQVLNMTRFPMECNMLGGDSRTHASGAGAISASYHEELKAGMPEKSVRISYGGSIGVNYGGGGFSYAIWETGLLGFDAREYDSLVLKLKGQKGGEQPNIYLDDGTVRRCIRASEFASLSDSWQEIVLPLKRFGDAGVDLSHLEALQIDFEWEEMAGTIYLSEARFASAPRTNLEVSKDLLH
jgi:RHS repeat-associated protein